MAFQCPSNSEIYVDRVISRCRRYIAVHHWTIQPTALEAWVSNFVTPEERHLAACLLDSVIFRNEEQVKAMIKQMLQRTLSDALAAPGEFGEDWQTLLGDPLKDPGIRLIPVIRDTDPPTKSGPLVARLFHRLGGVADIWMTWPWLIQRCINTKAKAIVLIDDFLGSGVQFKAFAKKLKLSQISGTRIVYAPLIAHPDGIDCIAKSHPEILTVPGEVLPLDASHFRNPSKKIDGHNETAEAQKIYENYWERLGINLPRRRAFGWRGLGLALVFQHATPNATLPLFWLNKSPHKPIFQR